MPTRYVPLAHAHANPGRSPVPRPGPSHRVINAPPDPIEPPADSPRARRLGEFHGDYVRSLRVLAWARLAASQGA